MNQYSQHRLKIAATEPEHVVRKAEFDIAVQSLDERIIVIEQKTFDGRPTVLQTTQLPENIVASDSLESPQTVPVSEIVSIAENAVGDDGRFGRQRAKSHWRFNSDSVFDHQNNFRSGNRRR